MTIGEFITELQKYPPDTQLAIPIDCCEECFDYSKDTYQKYRNGCYFRATPTLTGIKGYSVVNSNWGENAPIEDFLLITTPLTFE